MPGLSRPCRPARVRAGCVLSLGVYGDPDVGHHRFEGQTVVVMTGCGDPREGWRIDRERTLLVLGYERRKNVVTAVILDNKKGRYHV